MDALHLKTAPLPALLTPPKVVQFLHPGYEPVERPLLFSLPVVDQSRDHPERWGIYHETALAACRIVAANRPGWLATDRVGASPVETPLHGLLTGSTYYYIVDGEPATTKYPIVPSFRDWPFPADGLPEEWATATLSDTVQRSGLCQLTSQRFPERARLVPRFEHAWLARSPLDVWNDSMNDEHNFVELRSDIHTLFDRKMFALVPKRPDPTHRHAFVGHILDDEATSYYPALHNYTVQCLNQLAGPFLYARFAWAILSRTKGFLTAGPERVVAVRTATGDADVKTMPGAMLKLAYGSGGGSCNATPLKRPWTSRSGDLCDQEFEAGDNDDNDNDDDGYDDDGYDHVHQTVEFDADLSDPFALPMSDGG